MTSGAACWLQSIFSSAEQNSSGLKALASSAFANSKTASSAAICTKIKRSMLNAKFTWLKPLAQKLACLL